MINDRSFPTLSDFERTKPYSKKEFFQYQKIKGTTTSEKMMIARMQDGANTYCHQLKEFYKGHTITLSPDKKLGYIDSIRSDFFAKNLDSYYFIPDKVQGNISIDSLIFMIEDLKICLSDNLLNLIEKREIKRACKSLKQTQQISLELQIILNFQTEAKIFLKKGQKENFLRQKKIIKGLWGNLITKIENQLKNLQQDEVLILPGGTSDHTIVYEFKRTGGTSQNPLFSMTAFNTGIGSEYHRSPGLFSFFNPKAKIHSYLISNVPLKNILERQSFKRPNLIEQLLKIPIKMRNNKYNFPLIPSCINTFKNYSSISTIYKLLKKSLLKDGATLEISKNRHQIQNQGSCSRRPYNNLLQDTFLSKVNYKKYKYKATQVSIERMKKISNDLDPKIIKDKKISKLVKYLFYTSLIARFFMCLFHHISNEALIHLGEKILKKRKMKLLSHKVKH